MTISHSCWIVFVHIHMLSSFSNLLSLLKDDYHLSPTDVDVISLSSFQWVVILLIFVSVVIGLSTVALDALEYYHTVVHHSSSSS